MNNRDKTLEAWKNDDWEYIENNCTPLEIINYKDAIIIYELSGYGSIPHKTHYKKER